MLCSCRLFTNNPLIKAKIKRIPTRDECKAERLVFVEGTSMDVLIAVRDAVHMGAKILSHPLYGNLRPYQQPYRTVLVQDDARYANGMSCDIESLSLIESALDVYGACLDRLIKPEDLTEFMRNDYAFVDFELIKQTFVDYGVLVTD